MDDTSGAPLVISPGPAAAVGPYSPALLSGDSSDRRLYISGQIAIDPESGEVLKGSVEDQCRRIMDNIGIILNKAEMSYSDLVQCRLYLSDMGDFSRINEVYASYLSEPYPTRATIEVARLPKDVDLEIEAIAEQRRPDLR